MKLINADILIKEISRAPVWTSLAVKEMINEHITYDIVRCKDCNQSVEYATEFGTMYFCEWYRWYNEADDYCSYGERKESE